MVHEVIVVTVVVFRNSGLLGCVRSGAQKPKFRKELATRSCWAEHDGTCSLLFVCRLQSISVAAVPLNQSSLHRFS